MKRSIFAMAIALAATIGCQPKTADENGTGAGLEVNAPGVEVKSVPGEGVEVKAPGVDVEASRSEGAKADVNAGQSQ